MAIVGQLLLASYVRLLHCSCFLSASSPPSVHTFWFSSCRAGCGPQRALKEKRCRLKWEDKYTEDDCRPQYSPNGEAGVLW